MRSLVELPLSNRLDHRSVYDIVEQLDNVSFEDRGWTPQYGVRSRKKPKCGDESVHMFSLVLDVKTEEVGLALENGGIPVRIRCDVCGAPGTQRSTQIDFQEFHASPSLIFTLDLSQAAILIIENCLSQFEFHYHQPFTGDHWPVDEPQL